MNRRRTTILLLALLPLIASDMLAAVPRKPTPAKPPSSPPSSDNGSGSGSVTRESLLPPKTDHPEDRQWRITSYVKGTPAQVKGTLDKEIVEFAKKIGLAQRELKILQKQIADKRADLTVVLHKRSDYVKLTEQVALSKAALDDARARGSSAAERIEASSNYNRLKTDLDKLEKGLDADPGVADLLKRDAELRERISTHRATARKSLEWRQTLVEALVTTVTITGPISVGESIGILGEVEVREVDGNDVIAGFDLFENQKVVKKGEGVYSVMRSGKRVPIKIRGLDDKLNTLKPGEKLKLHRVFCVTDSQPVKPAGRLLTVEPQPSDLDYLLQQIETPPDIDKIAAQAEQSDEASDTTAASDSSSKITDDATKESALTTDGNDAGGRSLKLPRKESKP